jgi:hypothetical protein
MTANCSPSPLTFLGGTMTAILYTLSFTTAFFLSLFFGWSDDTTLTKQLSMMFSGFCLGGIAIIVIETMTDNG